MVLDVLAALLDILAHQRREEGVGLDDCSEVYRTLYPRIELLYDSKHVHLEVSSPGVYRKVKHAREFGLFIGSSVRLLLDDTGDWLKGTIQGASDSAVDIATSQGNQRIEYADIRKAQLDYP